MSKRWVTATQVFSIVIGTLGSLAAIAALFVGPSDTRPLLSRALMWSRSETGQFAESMLGLIVVGVIVALTRPCINRMWSDDSVGLGARVSVGRTLFPTRPIVAFLIDAFMGAPVVGWD
jgi:hypothetical protein